MKYKSLRIFFVVATLLPSITSIHAMRQRSVPVPSDLAHDTFATGAPISLPPHEGPVAGGSFESAGHDDAGDAAPETEITDLERQITADLLTYNYPDLQTRIRKLYCESGLKPEMLIIHKLAQRTGDFCLLFKSIRCDLQAFRTSAFTLESPDALQALIIKMLTHYILTMCDTIVVLNKGLADQDVKRSAWKVLNIIYHHWLTKWLLPHTISQPDSFRFNELLDVALTNVNKYLKLDPHNHAAYSSVPEHVMLVLQAYRGSWLVGVYTNDLYYARSITPSEIAATRMTRAPEQRFHNFSEISEKLKSSNFETIFTTDPLTFCSK